MSISENTTKINQLITKINDLPSAAPTVRRVESSFTVTYVPEMFAGQNTPMVYVECGFRPDVVCIATPPFSEIVDGSGVMYTFSSSLLFSEIPDGYYIGNNGYVVGTDGTVYMVSPMATATENGFKLVAFFGTHPSTGQQEDLTGKTFNYVAIKYT